MLQPSRWFWLIATAGLLWNLFGLAMFWQNLTLSAEAIAALPDAQRQVSQAMPGWTFVPFAIATVAGVLGTVGLPLRRRWSVGVMLLSLLVLVAQFSAIYLTTAVWALAGLSGVVFPLLLWVVGKALCVYARRCAARPRLH